VIEPPFVAPHGSAADRPELVAAAGEDERQASARIAFAESEPARLVVRGFDDATGEKDGAVEERLDLRWLDSVLLALAPVRGVPVEFPRSSCECAEPLVQAAVRRE